MAAATATPASQRRGSGVSITLNPTPSVAGVVTAPQAPSGVQMTAGGAAMYPGGGYYANQPMFMQTPSYPVLMNPPPMPTVNT